MKYYALIVCGAAIGALAGWLYWKYVGCATGTCPITARPLSSTLYGALIGGLLLGTVTSSKPKINKSPQQTEKHDKHA